jgi:hypothetical protein
MSKMITDQKHNHQFVLSDAVLFDLIVLVFFLVILILAFNYNPRARSIPLGLGIAGSIMMFLQFLADAIPRLRSKLGFVVRGGILGGEKDISENDEKSDQTSLPKKESSGRFWWQVSRITLWLAGFIILLSLVNYLIAVGAFIILITKIEAKERWIKALLLAVSVDICFFILFDIILQVQL